MVEHDIGSALDTADREGRIFFFQAEDGIRDLTVTGVQTCALPISFASAGSSSAISRWAEDLGGSLTRKGITFAAGNLPFTPENGSGPVGWTFRPGSRVEIGRASCRERVEISVGAGSVKEKRRQVER